MLQVTRQLIKAMATLVDPASVGGPPLDCDTARSLVKDAWPYLREGDKLGGYRCAPSDVIDAIVDAVLQPERG